MSEYCKEHRQDFNLMVGCSSCRSDAEPIIPPGLITDLSPKVKELEAEINKLRLQLADILETRVFEHNLLVRINRRGYLARGEYEQMKKFFAELEASDR